MTVTLTAQKVADVEVPIFRIVEEKLLTPRDISVDTGTKSEYEIGINQTITHKTDNIHIPVCTKLGFVF